MKGSTISVSHKDGERFAVAIRDHQLEVDQPLDEGGADAGPTPTELFVASLASCVAYYAHRFLVARGLPDEVDVTTTWEMASRPARVGRIDMKIDVQGIPSDRREAFERAVEHCTVHNSLMQAPEITFEISAADVSA